jgi:hypothetical protein
MVGMMDVKGRIDEDLTVVESFVDLGGRGKPKGDRRDAEGLINRVGIGESGSSTEEFGLSLSVDIGLD